MIASTDTRPAGAWFWLVPTLVCLLILSGICALVYQVIWLRLLSLTFGVTTHAASTVLASFMGGLALGSFAAGRLADRVRHPLRLFGLVELSIGLCALATPAALAGVHRLYLAVFPHLPESLTVATAIRFALSFAVLLVPTALMGATLPIVVKSSLARIDRIGTRIGVLYASNTAGAIVGALLAGFYLIPHTPLGVSASSGDREAPPRAYGARRRRRGVRIRGSGAVRFSAARPGTSACALGRTGSLARKKEFRRP